MDMHQPVSGMPGTQKNTLEKHREETVSTGSGISHDFSGTPEHPRKSTVCPGGMTLACSVYRTIRQLEDLCGE
jgi:hypothetical protein